MWLYVISCTNQGRQSAPEQSDVIQKHPEIKKDCISLPPFLSPPCLKRFFSHQAKGLNACLSTQKILGTSEKQARVHASCDTSFVVLAPFELAEKCMRGR